MAPTPGRKILVVDDDPWIAKMLEFVASDLGHTAVVCKDGVDAIEKFAELMPDLVLLDVVLPRLDGLKVCEHIKKTPIGRLTPVLVFSGIYRDSTEALKFGADAFLPKPFTPQQMGQLIKQMLPILAAPPAHDLAAPPLRPANGEISLAVEPLPKALGRLHRDKLTGVLTLRSRVGIKYLFVERGDVVQVRSPATASGVTTALLGRGRVTALQLEKLEKEARESSGKKILSQLLVESGLVRAEELRKLVLSQMLWEIFEVFRWREGMHGFAESPPLPGSAGQFKLDVATPNLIHWGVRRMDPKPEDLDALLPNRMTFLARTPDADELLKPLLMTERERGILGLIDGSKTVQEIVSIADLAGADATQALYTLLCIGAVVTSEGPLARPGLPSPEEHSTEPRSLPGPFALALMELWRSRESGLLRCVSSLDNRAVYVNRGAPIFARSERNTDRLDQLLVKGGVITPEQAAKSLELQQRGTGNKRVGQILVEMGALRLEQLHGAVKSQVQNLVLSLFTWTDGKYLFEPGALPTQEAITLDWDTPGAVLLGLRGLPLNYIRPLAPPKDSIIERTPGMTPGKGMLAGLQLNASEQKLLALLVGRHPMQQLLALDFIAHESLLRGLVMFAALGLIVVEQAAAPLHEILEEDSAVEGELLDPLEPRPNYLKAAPLVPAAPAAPTKTATAAPSARDAAAPSRPPAPRKSRVYSPSASAWPDPVPAANRDSEPVAAEPAAAEPAAAEPEHEQRETEPEQGWTAPAEPRRTFLAGPSLAAFEAEHDEPRDAREQTDEEPESDDTFTFAHPDEGAHRDTFSAADAAAVRDSHPEAQEPTEAERKRFAAELSAFAAERKSFAAQQGLPPAPLPPPEESRESRPREEKVSRRMYDALLAEKQELQQKLLSVLESRRDEATVPRELFDQMQAEKRQLQEKMMLMLDELLRLRQQPEKSDRPEKPERAERQDDEKDLRSNLRPFPGSRKNE